jgi:hypothetical protein
MNDSLTCPKCGGISTDAEFCSECGAAMAAPHAPVATPAAPVPAEAGADACPVCGETRPGPFARYCDNCRYDFLTKQPFSAAPAPAAPPPPGAAPARAVGLATQRWDLHATVDLSLRRPDDPMPQDSRERLFPLDLADHLIGRRSDGEDIHPEITIADPGISRRHVRILRAADGALSARDLGSMNGTRLNGAPLEPNVPAPLAEGDQITLGCWTRLTVKAR